MVTLLLSLINLILFLKLRRGISKIFKPGHKSTDSNNEKLNSPEVMNKNRQKCQIVWIISLSVDTVQDQDSCYSLLHTYYALVSRDGAVVKGAQGWRSGERARLPPMWSGLDSRFRRRM